MASAIRFCSAADGSKIAYAKDGARPPLVRAGLSARETDVLERIAQGLDNAQIAAHLQAIVKARSAGLGLARGD